MRSVVVLLWLLAFGRANSAAQGLDEYCNFESPQVKPIAVTTMQGNFSTKQFVLACNTPDNTVEVYDITAGNRDTPQFVTAIPVGLEPVSVVSQSITISGDTKHMLYTVNWLGDSVTFVECWLSLVSQEFRYRVIKEVRVTEPLEEQGVHNGVTDLRCDDEPMHLALVNRPGNAGQFLIVTKRAASSYSRIHPFTGDFLDARTNASASPPNGAVISGGGRNVIMTLRDTATSNNGQAVFTESPRKYPDALVALKKPHTVAWRPGTDEFWVLGHQGGGSQASLRFGFDFALWGIRTPASGPNTYFGTGGLGSTNFNMAFNSAGTYLYVVGTEAQDHVTGNGNLEGLDSTGTGFAKTMLYRVNMTTGVVHARDLNLVSGSPVNGTQQSLAHATDIAMYENPANGDVYACVAAFHSSRFGMIRVQTAGGPIGLPQNWVIATSDVEPSVAPREAGPRGIAILSTGTQANDRAYTLNRLDGSISVINLNGGTPAFVTKLSMQPSPEPAYIRDGRKFLYSTQFSGPGRSASPGQPGSGSLAGFVSCASCHVDGRTDGVSWRLTAASSPAPLLSSVVSPPPQTASDVVEVALPPGNPIPFASGFPSDPVPPGPGDNAKGAMFTQSLQGLSNFEVGGSRIVSGNIALSTGLFADEDDGAATESGTDDDAKENAFDDLISNAPYHWRGDKDTFRHFNEAFVNLQGKTAAANAIPEGGLTTAEMKSFERFINSIHYPPNPNEPQTREYSGQMWDAQLQNATGAVLGLQLFHTKPLPVGDPDDDGNPAVPRRSCIQCHTFPEGSNNRVTNTQTGQPLETAALRGVVQKEAVLRLSSEALPSSADEPGILTGDFGLAHTGTNPAVKSVNGFLAAVFNGFPTANDDILDPAEHSAITQFVRELDAGVAPIVGLSFSLTNAPTAAETSWIDELEAQAEEANCGIAVYAHVISGGSFVNDGFWYDVTQTSSAKYKRVGTTTFLTRTQLLALLPQNQADDVLVFRGTPLGSDRRVASFALASSDLPPGTIGVPSNIGIVGTSPNTANDPIVGLSGNWDPNVDVFWPAGIGPIPLTLRVLLQFQDVILGQRRHDPPRRLQVIGTGLRTGARLRLTLPNVTAIPMTGPEFRNMELPLYPTAEFVDVGGTSWRIWETEAEFDARALYTMILGGPADPDVDTVLRTGAGSPSPKVIRVQAANLPYTTWSLEAQVTFNYPKKP